MDTQSREWEVSSAQLMKTHGYAARTDFHRQTEQAREASQLAKEIIRLARNTLLIHLRFLEPALVRLAPGDETVTPEMATDGRFLYYNSLHVCRAFQKDRQVVARDYLHVTLHCVFRHLFVGAAVNADLWDLACDIAVEHLINELNLKALYAERQEKQGWLIAKLRAERPRLTAERIYRYLTAQELPPQEIARIRAYFYADDHKIWHRSPEKTSSNDGGGEKNDPAADGKEGQDAGANANGEDLFTPPDGEDAQEVPGASGGRDTGEKGESGDGEGHAGAESERQEDKPAFTPEATERMWQEISERIQVDLDTTSSSWGENAGDFVSALREINREKVDYAAFLRRFSVLGENVRVNDDEFDYIFYTYGLRLNGNMPLVEPLEYREDKRVREFVIALDTSESVAGELVQTFVTKTWNILKQTENFFNRVNVHILQCGARVEEDAKITDEDSFDAYIRRMTLRGFGGTDFRPVFEHVDRLIAQHEFTNFKGLIYFTDGYGTFPAMPPAYEAAFVFVDDGREPPDVPPWAIRMLMTPEDIRTLEVPRRE